MEFSHQQLKQYHQKDNQAPTEASSEINKQWYSYQEFTTQPLLPQQQSNNKKFQNKIKYRRLIQKLNNIVHQQEEKFFICTKDMNSQNKNRIMKQINNFQRIIKSKNKDLQQIDIPLREILKILDMKLEQDLYLIRNLKLIPIYFDFLQKIPSMHKNQLIPSLRALETGLKILYIFSSMSTNRDYLIITNRMKSLVSICNWLLTVNKGKDQRKTLFLGFRILNVLIIHKNKTQAIQNIIKTTNQVILCSQILRKLKFTIEQLCDQETIEGITVIELLKFIFNILKRQKQSQQNQLEFKNNDLIINPHIDKQVSSNMIVWIEYLSHFLVDYLQTIKYDLEDESIPKILINIYYMVFKIFNTMFELSYPTSKKQVQIDSIVPIILKLTIYCKQSYQKQWNRDEKTLLNEIIIFIGYISLEDQCIQKKISQSSILEELYNLPVQFMMDSYLNHIITPTLCSLIHNNKSIMNSFLKDNSPFQIINYLKNEIQAKSIVKSNSTKSLFPNNEVLNTNSQDQRLALKNRFPERYWGQLCNELQRYGQLQ